MTLMSLNTLIRKAIPGEIETLADIAFVTWERDLRPFLSGPATGREAEQNRLSAAVRDGLDRIIVAEVNDVAAGWCQRMRGRPYIPFLFVTPLLQNQGVGSALLRRMESMLELEGHERIQLDTLADNVRAVNFYQHQGYQILALKSEGQPGREAPMSVRLEKRLDPWRGPIDDTGKQ
ncbi:MAG TPA: GNAT family N-acetyltransferase [Devosia sp.]|jgi:ribosomal-protein-alanine N-acetyltransferase|nr:GNAT family N-acetyltransferase [Devosia sp.]